MISQMRRIGGKLGILAWGCAGRVRFGLGGRRLGLGGWGVMRVIRRGEGVTFCCGILLEGRVAFRSVWLLVPTLAITCYRRESP